jgi:hypothetical protein
MRSRSEIDLLKAASTDFDRAPWHGIDLFRACDVQLDGYIDNYRQKNNYDFFLLADALEFSEDFYLKAVDTDFSLFRWSRGGDCHVALSPGLEKGIYRLDCDVQIVQILDYNRPPFMISVNEDIVKTYHKKGRRVLSAIIEIKEPQSSLSLNFKSHAWIPREISNSFDDRLLGFKLYWVGLKKFERANQDTGFELDIGNQDDEPFLATGFYSPEGKEERYRWTNGDAILRVPIIKTIPANGIFQIRAGLIGPAGISDTVKLTLDGKEIPSITMKPSVDMYSTRVPFEVLPGIHTLSVNNRKWKPEDPNSSKESRTLGLFIDWLKLSPGTDIQIPSAESKQ